MISLAQELIRIDTSRGDEASAMNVVASILEPAGFDLTWVPWLPRRPNLIAKWRGGGPLTLAAHLDTVPFEASSWTHDPLGGDIVDGRLYGRGSSDMKAGAAAMVHAGVRAAAGGCGPFTMAFTSAEEVGCLGAAAVVAAQQLDRAPILIVGEATDNELRFGHKGATWLEVVARGRSAHGSRPDLGDNAIDRLADAIAMMRDFSFPEAHPVLGTMTTNIGTIAGGQQTNLVPDYASMTIDVRTVPGQDAGGLVEVLRSSAVTDVREILSVPSVWTDPASSLSARADEIVRRITGIDSPSTGVTYFTDGAVLADRTDPAVFIVGPGGIEQPHTADEYVRTDRIEEASTLYRTFVEELA